MSRTSTHTTRNCYGFSLVELAIALTVIGLLLAGLVKGTELMDNARINRMAVDFNNTQAAMINFKRIYNALPGDMPDAADRITNCSATPCNGDGNGNFQIDKTASFSNPYRDDAYPALSEMRAFWVQLARTGMIDGIDPDYTGTPNRPGVDFPETPLGGGYRVFSTDAYGFGPRTNVMRPAASLATEAGNAASLLTAKQAAQIERKLDDGNPQTGRILGVSGNTFCRVSASITDRYPENDRNAKCNILFVLGQ